MTSTTTIEAQASLRKVTTLGDACEARAMELAAGKELRREAARFKHLFLQDQGMKFEQFLNVLTDTLDSIVPEVLSMDEAEILFESAAASNSASSSAAGDLDNKDAASSQSRMAFDIFESALEQVGQACARKLARLVRQRSLELRNLSNAAIFQRLQCTKWLVSGLRQRDYAALRIRGDVSGSKEKWVVNRGEDVSISPMGSMSTQKLPMINTPRVSERGPEGESSDEGARDVLAQTQNTFKKSPLSMQQARASKARQVAQHALASQRSLLLRRRARGNEMSITLQAVRTSECSRNNGSLTRAVHDLKSSVKSLYRETFGALACTPQEAASALVDRVDDLYEKDLREQAAQAMTYSDRRCYDSLNPWCPKDKGQEWLNHTLGHPRKLTCCKDLKDGRQQPAKKRGHLALNLRLGLVKKRGHLALNLVIPCHGLMVRDSRHSYMRKQ
jgi:hypothetical protein